jgi:uncharacterized membrane protein
MYGEKKHHLIGWILILAIAALLIWLLLRSRPELLTNIKGIIFKSP